MGIGGSVCLTYSSSSHRLELVVFKGGDIFEPGLLEIPLSQKNFASTAIIIVADLSKPQNLIESLLKWIKATREGIYAFLFSP